MKTLSLLGLCMLISACMPMHQLPPLSLPQDTQPTIIEQAYEFKGISTWINTQPLTREELKGKVVLVDFWTYSCINCVRTLPYLTSWDAKYRDEGLVIVGIHTPEFDFEKDPDNVAKAVEKYGIKYAVGMDNDYATWKNYDNRWWPHSYLFDREGKLIYDHIGEGGYDELEAKIQEALAVEEDMTAVALPDYSKIGSPEIYLGGETTRGNTRYDATLGTHDYTMFNSVIPNTVQLGGNWTVYADHITAGTGASLILAYDSRDIHVVAGGQGTVIGVVDGKDITPVSIDGDDLYTLASTTYDEHTIILQVEPGVEFYTFTFG